MRLKSLFFLLSGALIFISPHTSKATAACLGLGLVDTGSGGYKIVAQGLINVGAIDLILTYDKASLSGPKVVRGDFADWLIFLPNIAETSGTVRVAMVNEPPVSGSGTVATITFTPVGKSWGRPVLTCTLTSLDASNQPSSNPLTTATEQNSPGTEPLDTVDSDSGQLTVPTVPTVPAVPAQPKSPPRDYSEEPVSTVPYVAPGAVNLGSLGSVGESQPSSEQSSPLEQESNFGEQPTQWQPPPGDEEHEVERDEPSPEHAWPLPPATVPPSTGSTQEQKYIVYKGILQRFKEYAGNRTSRTLVALFNQPVVATIKQEPPICITDGKSTLKVLIDLPGDGNHAPNFALRGASLKSLKKQGDNRWVLEAVPVVGGVEATLTIVNGEKMTDYPFTIAPPADINIDKKGGVDETDFSLFLSMLGTETAPAFDLNGDGRRDYVDDYIYTANYLVFDRSKKEKKK